MSDCSSNWKPARSTSIASNDERHSAKGTTLSSHQDDQLDIHLMQTIRETKYIQRPKFLVFGDVCFQRECLDAHNEARLRHRCPLLTWCQQLADHAQAMAEKITNKGRILYPEIPGVGDNVLLKDASHEDHLMTGHEVVNVWYSESANVNFDNPKWHQGSQHFTQLIWRESQMVGLARCWNKAKNIVAVVALYRPAGNMNAPGEFARNIPPPLPLYSAPATPVHSALNASRPDSNYSVVADAVAQSYAHLPAKSTVTFAPGSGVGQQHHRSEPDSNQPVIHLINNSHKSPTQQRQRRRMPNCK